MENKLYETLRFLSPLPAFCNVNQGLICVLKGYSVIRVELIWGGLLATVNWLGVDT